MPYIGLKIDIDKAQLDGVKAMLSGISGGADKALTRSINKSLVNVRTRAVKEIGADLNLKSSRIKKDFDIKKASFTKMVAFVRCQSVPPGLINFSSRQVRKGVTTKVRKKGSRKLVKHAFIATFKGNKHVAKRINKHVGKGVLNTNKNRAWGMMPRKYRFPIKILYAVRPADFMAQPQILNPLEEYASERVSTNLDHEAKAILNRYA
jgi:hypothetical protein